MERFTKEDMNEWRVKYDTMSYEDHCEFYNKIEVEEPTQAYFTVDNVIKVLDGFSTPFKVLEFGGWKGELALKMIERYGDAITSWTNIEICESAVNKSVCSFEKYKAVKPRRFDWFAEERVERPDVIIATHFIEHLSDAHFELLAKYVSGVPVVYFEAPIMETRVRWDNYPGTHMLHYGWADIKIIMEGYRYQSIDLRKDGAPYNKSPYPGFIFVNWAKQMVSMAKWRIK